MEKAFEYIRDTYNVPAEIGREILFEGRKGIIIEDRGNYIGVNFDDDKPGIISPLHPTYNVEYLGMGKIRKISRSQARYREYLNLADCYDSFFHFLKVKHSKSQ